MKMFGKSKRLYETSKRHLASGVSSNLRSEMKPVPIFINKAQGSRMVDEDSVEFIDYIMAYGPQMLGHSHPAIVDAIKSQIEIGQTYGAQHKGEIELAKKITEYVPCAEKVSFSSTGTEAVQLALRLSRAYTGKQKIIRFDGHYHGWADTIAISFTEGEELSNYKNPKSSPSTAGQNVNALTDVIVLPWNDVEMLEATINEFGGEIAAIITEPIMCNSGCISPKQGYLERMRELASNKDILLIFDEVITGFRLGLGGAQEKLNVTPDLVTLGKAVAGGLPLSAVGGKKEIMDLVSDNTVYHMGTQNGNPLSVSAALASIKFLSRKNGHVYKNIETLTNKLTNNLEKLAEEYKIPLLINKQGTIFHTMFTSYKEVDTFYKFQQRDIPRFNKFTELLMAEGVAVRPSGLWYLSVAHTQKDIGETLDKIEKCFNKMKKEQ
ncbi:aspartate aminotransferase family protein [Virgibacillus sp. W0181]|uniref:aspartate aminotransferase family protein n=1 Tax=Virgibacillus sp. W0181 TaxID=3391581 RepID=UPI003F44D9BE